MSSFASSSRPCRAVEHSFLRSRHGRSARVARLSVLARVTALNDVQAVPTFVDGQPQPLPATSGVYAIYDSKDTLQYIGISRTISLSVEGHSKALGNDLVSSVKVGLLENATKDMLTDAWKEWLQAAVAEGGSVPPGNAPGPEKEKWQPQRKSAVKQEIKLTSGKGVQDLTVDIKELIEMVVKNERIVAFVKGTRTQPQCGFSYQLLTTLNTMQADYQVVNVLDETYNPGLRDAIKEYSAWPTIPQLYVDGEFVGGSDIVQEMAGNGELAKLVRGIKN